MSTALDFVAALTGRADARLHWRALDDVTGPERRSGYNFFGTLAEVEPDLRRLNDDGYGVFAVVNEGGQKRSDIKRVRAVFVDQDDGRLPDKWHVKPDILVQRDETHWHAYWAVDDLPLADFRTAQLRLAEHYNTDRKVFDLPRVMRVPGFLHNKNRDNPIEVQLVHGCHPSTIGFDCTPVEALLRGLPTVEVQPEDAEPREPSASPPCVRMTSREAVEALGRIDPGCDNATWVKVGQALHSCKFMDGTDSFELWDEWSQASNKYPGRAECLRRWNSFSWREAGGIRIESLFEVGRPTTKQEPAALPANATKKYYQGAEIATAFPPVEYIFANLIPSVDVTLWIGGFDAGKTVATVGLAMSAAAGQDWCGYKFTGKPLTVVYFAGESHELTAEYAAIYAQEELKAWPERFFLSPTAPNLLCDEDVEATIAEIDELRNGGPVLLIGDSFSRMSAMGDDRNNEAEVQRIMNAARRLAQGVDGAFIILGHPTKAETGEQPTTLSGSQVAMNSAAASIAFWNTSATKKELQALTGGRAIRCIKPMRVRGVAQPERQFVELVGYDLAGRGTNRPIARPVPATEVADLQPAKEKATRLDAKQQRIVDIAEWIREKANGSIEAQKVGFTHHTLCEEKKGVPGFSDRTLTAHLKSTGRVPIPGDAHYELSVEVRAPTGRTQTERFYCLRAIKGAEKVDTERDQE